MKYYPIRGNDDVYHEKRIIGKKHGKISDNDLYHYDVRGVGIEYGNIVYIDALITEIPSIHNKSFKHEYTFCVEQMKKDLQRALDLYKYKIKMIEEALEKPSIRIKF